MTQTFLSFQFSSSVQLISLPIGGHEAAEDADTMTVDLPHAHVCWKHYNGYNGLQAGHDFFVPSMFAFMLVKLVTTQLELDK